jgi:hypothetical protein
LSKIGQDLWREGKTGKEIYDDLGARAKARGYRLDQDVVGHRLGDFPHQRFTKQRLPLVEFAPSSHLWILELQIIHDELKHGAFYEDLLF